MAFPKLIPETSIERIKEHEAKHQKHLESVGYDPQYNEIEMAQARQRKERWLELFSQCFSPALTCKQLGINVNTYRKWRTTDSWFAEQINECINDWREEVLTSAIGRAVGYVREGEDGEIETDASGKIIRHGASDSLTKSLLDWDRPEEKQSSGGVVVEINVGALLGKIQIEDDSVVDEQ